MRIFETENYSIWNVKKNQSGLKNQFDNQEESPREL